jgi:hypothetical protein
MIYLNYLLQVILLLVLLSVESTLALPIFSLFFAFKLLDKLNPRDDQSFYYLILALVVLSIVIAVFYQLTITLAVLLMCSYYYLRTLVGSRVFIKSFQQWQFLQLLLFAILQLVIFFTSGLSMNVFMIGQGLLVVLILIFKTIIINKL